MNFFFLLTVVIINTQVFSQIKIYKNTLKPFSSDGCSLFLDGFGNSERFSWQHCCVEHDIGYWQGGTLKQRRKVDAKLKDCVNKVVPSLGSIMFLALYPGGTDKLPFSWRWGYGWVTPRGNSPLTDYEQAQADQLGFNFLNVKVKDKKLIEKREIISGDYCIDLVLQKIIEENNLASINYEIVKDKISLRQESLENKTLFEQEILREDPSWQWHRDLVINIKELKSSYAATLLLERKSLCYLQKGSDSKTDLRRSELPLNVIKIESFSSYPKH